MLFQGLFKARVNHVIGNSHAQKELDVYFLWFGGVTSIKQWKTNKV